MRVAIICQQIDVRRGGAETSVLEMARHLAAAGVNATIIAAGDTDGEQIEGDVRVLRIGVAGGRLMRTRMFVRKTDACTAAGTFDIVHAVTPCLSADVYQPRSGIYREMINRSVARAESPAGRVLRRFGRQFNLRQRYMMGIERAMMTRSDPPYVASVSGYVARQVIEAFPAFPRERIVDVFNGVGIEPLSEADHAAARAEQRAAWQIGAARLIAFVGHNFALKGLSELLRACAALEALDWRLVVAGDGKTRRFRRLARRLGIAGRVTFAGNVRDIHRLYAAADLLAHPTWFDPCSRVVLEAMCLGVPVVTTHYNGAAEAIDPSVHGGIIDEPRDIDALAAELRRCLDPTFAERCRAQAADVRPRLSMARHARELAELYQRVVSA